MLVTSYLQRVVVSQQEERWMLGNFHILRPQTPRGPDHQPRESFMRVARAFSTSLQHARQALYEPYVPPLNQEQKKALRKMMLAEQPRLHSKFSRDVEFMLKAYSVSNSTQKKRRNTLQRINEIVQSAYGSKYSVIDRSLSQYSRDFEYAPLELSISDNSRPTGFPPDQLGPQFPDPYNHEALARLLQQHGYSGSFVAGDAMRNQPPPAQVRRRPTTSIEHGPYPITHPWPNYTPHPTLYLTYPPVLWAEAVPEDSDSMPFFISPPVPTHAPLLRLLKAYTSFGEHVQDMVTFVFLWSRSIGMAELTPTCAALMVIGWLQHRKVIPSLQNPENKEDIQRLSQKDDGVWFTNGSRSRADTEALFSSTWLETGFVAPNIVKPPRKLSSMLHDFFAFWSQKGDGSFIHSTQYISVREGSVVSREQHTQKDHLVFEKDNKAIARGIVPSVNSQPIMWQSQHIVIQDPFVPSFNHAHSLSRNASIYFQYYCSLSQRTMGRSHPMTTIVGDKIPRPNNTPWSPRVRDYSTTPLSEDIKHMYAASIPPQPILDSRQRTISRVQKAIRERFGEGYTIECFGSTRYGVSTATSDLDLVIIDHKNIDGISPRVNVKRLPDIYNVRVVARTLMKKGFANVFTVPQAIVPIVKFRDPTSNLDCDLNINEQLGMWNTQLIAQYCYLAPDLLKPLIVVIKCWAKSHGMNDATGTSGPATFSSYALVLMLIGYLQIRGVLPSLQAGLDPLPLDAKDGAFWTRTKAKGSVRCDVRFKSKYVWSPKVQLNVEEALSGWFRFWANEYQYKEHLLSVREGRLIRRRMKGQQKKETQTIQDMEGMEGQQSTNQANQDATFFTSAEHVETDGSDAISDAENEGATEHGDEIDDIEQRKGLTEGQTTADDDLEDVTDEPVKWLNNGLIVADPFILSKNVCGNIGNAIVDRFRAECGRCTRMLEWGADLESLMGEVGNSRRGAVRGGKQVKKGARRSDQRGSERREAVPGGDADVADTEQANGRGGGARGHRRRQRGKETAGPSNPQAHHHTPAFILQT